MRLTSLPFFAAPEKWEDRPTIFGSTLLARVYRTLPLSYSLVGVLIYWYGDNLTLYDPQFCWQALGYSLMAQGPVSYLADVHDYGCTAANSHWKRIDLVLAPTLTFLVSIVLVTRCWLGRMSLPPTTLNVWAAGCAVAVTSKCLGAQASHQKSTSIETLMVWANLWHSNMVKVPPWQCLSSPPVPPQGALAALGSSDSQSEAQWAPRHRLGGCSRRAASKVRFHCL